MVIQKHYITLIFLLFCVGFAHSQESRKEICIDFGINSTTIESEPDTMVVEEAVVDTIAPEDSVMPAAEEWTRRIHLKTNAIGIGMGIINIAGEIDINQHWSFALPIYHCAWNYFTSTIKFRNFSVQPEFRYWLSENNDGFFAGAHFGMVFYNFAFNGAYRYQRYHRGAPTLGGGLSIGYRKPISNNKRWRMEFSLGAGVYPLHYDKFHNIKHTSDGLLVESVKKTYWGLDQVAVSFSYTFNLNKKGGKQ